MDKGTLWSPPDGTRTEKVYLTFEEIEAKYGLLIAQACNTATKDNKPYSKALARGMWRIHNGRYPKVETKEEWDALEKGAQDATEGGSEPAGRTKRKRVGLFYDNGIVQSGGIWRALNRKVDIMVYMTLNAYIVRGQMARDEHNLYKEYYLKRKRLACAKTYDEIAETTGLKNPSIARAINSLEDRGLIEVIPGTELKGAAATPSIYVLGKVEHDGNETFYADKLMDYQY